MKRSTKIISIVMALAMMLLCVPMGAFAAEEGIEVSIGVYDGTLMIPRKTITVTDGLAEEYGYTVKTKDHLDNDIEDVTVFDVIVAAHKDYYGEAFTPATAKNYLDMSSGYLSLAFGKSAYASGFTVNGDTPHDDVYNTTYGSYTGYSCDEAVVYDGDDVSFFYYQDTTFYSDITSSFDFSGAIIWTDEPEDCTETLTLTGYSVMYYGCSPDEVIEENTDVLAGVDVYCSKNGGEFELIGQTDENGQIDVKFDGYGDYTVVAYGETDDGPVLPTYATIELTETEKEDSVLVKIYNFLRTVFFKAVEFIKALLGGMC